MKKLLLGLLVFTTIISSCSSNDDNSNSSSNQITPPTWIQGTWSNQIGGFRFKTTDFCTVVSNLETCLAESIQQSSQVGATTNVQQTITDNEYTLSMTISSQTTTYSFIKISNTEIEYVNPTNGLPNTSLIKQ